MDKKLHDNKARPASKIQELTLVSRRGKKPYESYTKAFDRSLAMSPTYVKLMERERLRGKKRSVANIQHNAIK